MAKIFISYRFTGEDKEKLKSQMLQIHTVLDRAGHKHYSTIFDTDQFADEKWSGKKIMQKSFAEIDSSDVILFLVRGPEISPGMLVELGYALAKNKKLLLAIDKKITESIFRRQIAEVIEFETFQGLLSTLSKLNA